MHNKNLPEFVAFFDLVKSFVKVKHDLSMTTIERYGAPPIICSSIASFPKTSGSYLNWVILIQEYKR